MRGRSSGFSFGVAALGVGAALLGGGLGGWALLTWRSDRVVHDYIVTHPEVLPEAMANLRSAQEDQALAGVRGAVETPFPGSVLGNPHGAVTLVEFTDFACGYCRRSVADVEALVARRPDLRVVVRQLPILSPASGDAAKMGLAAAEQGKYAAFHRAMFELGHPGPETIAQAAKTAGLDLARARRVAAAPATQAEIDRNLDFARQLGLAGTPAWIARGHLLSGAIGEDRLARALDAAG
jgi:protein-disulfide isomerase